MPLIPHSSDFRIEPGFNGIVHTGTMEVEPSEPTPQVAVKLGFSNSDKATLEKEYELYSHLRAKEVQGIPQAIGLFVEDEYVDGEEGPYALVMTFAGVSLVGREKSVSSAVKFVFSSSFHFPTRALSFFNCTPLDNPSSPPSSRFTGLASSTAISTPETFVSPQRRKRSYSTLATPTRGDLRP